MEIQVKRIKKAKGYTAGKLFIDLTYHSFCIEDEDRELTQSMSLSDIKSKKKFGITAIPRGKYEISLTYSNKYKKLMPEILNVPGWLGVRIHSANKATELKGCIAIGYEDSSDGFMGESKKAFNDFMKVLLQRIKKEKVFIVIE